MLKTGQVYKSLRNKARWEVQENGMKCICPGELAHWKIDEMYHKANWKQRVEGSISEGKLVLDKEYTVKRLLEKLCA